MNLWQLLLTPLYALQELLIAILPDADAGTLTFITNGIVSIKETIQAADAFFPVTLFFTMISLIFLIETIVLFWRLGRYVMGNITLGFFK